MPSSICIYLYIFSFFLTWAEGSSKLFWLKCVLVHRLHCRCCRKLFSFSSSSSSKECQPTWLKASLGLLVWGLSAHSRIVHSYGDVTITGEWLLLNYAQHSWPLSSEGSLAFHTYGDTGHPCITVISEIEYPWHSHIYYCRRRFSSWAVTTCFNY